MNSFEEFINNLSSEQMEMLQAALDKASSRPVAKVPARELPSRLKVKEADFSNSRKVNEDFTVTPNEQFLEKRKTQVRAKKNEWEDTGEDRDPDFDPIKFEKMGKTSRSRSKIQKRNVECHICGRTFEINSNLVYGEFIRCNRCTGR